LNLEFVIISQDAPDPFKTAGIAFTRIVKSSIRDHLSIYSRSSSIQLRKAVGVRLPG